MGLGHVLGWPCKAHNVSLRADAERELASAASVVSANLQTKETPFRVSSFVIARLSQRYAKTAHGKSL